MLNIKYLKAQYNLWKFHIKIWKHSLENKVLNLIFTKLVLYGSVKIIISLNRAGKHFSSEFYYDIIPDSTWSTITDAGVRGLDLKNLEFFEKTDLFTCQAEREGSFIH